MYNNFNNVNNRVFKIEKAIHEKLILTESNECTVSFQVRPELSLEKYKLTVYEETLGAAKDLTEEDLFELIFIQGYERGMWAACNGIFE